MLKGVEASTAIANCLLMLYLVLDGGPLKAFKIATDAGYLFVVFVSEALTSESNSSRESSPTINPFKSLTSSFVLKPTKV